MNWQEKLEDVLRIKANLLRDMNKKVNLDASQMRRFEKKLQIINSEIKYCKEASLTLKEKIRLKKKIFVVLPKGMNYTESFSNNKRPSKSSQTDNTEISKKAFTPSTAPTSTNNITSFVSIPEFLQDNDSFLNKKRDRRAFSHTLDTYNNIYKECDIMEVNEQSVQKMHEFEKCTGESFSIQKLNFKITDNLQEGIGISQIGCESFNSNHSSEKWKNQMIEESPLYENFEFFQDEYGFSSSMTFELDDFDPSRPDKFDY
jgi:hypothetical protein